jgi:hypothetical protein
MRITSKRAFFEAWEAGILGNRTNLWRDPAAAYASGAPEIGFREIRPYGTAGKGAWEKVPRALVAETAARWREAGRQFVMDDGAPDDKRTLCGEICRTYRGWEGTLGVVRCPMREAMALGLLLPRTGATVLALLDRYMDPSSRGDLDDLLELYPDAVVELSCFDVDVGIFPGRNTIFWETRDY